MSDDLLARAVKAAIPSGTPLGLSTDEAVAGVHAALNAYRRNKRRPSASSITAQRAQLKKAAHYAAKLSACLQVLNAETSVYLTPSKNDLWPSQYCEHLDKLKAHAERAHKAMADVRRDAPKDPALHELLVTLTVLWSRAHPKQRGVTRSGGGITVEGDVYRGPLLEFVSDVLKIAGIEHTRTGLGKRLRRLYSDLRLVWRRGKKGPNSG